MNNNSMAEVVDGHTVVFAREVPHAPERVWRAISEQSELTAWMRYPVEFTAEAGASVDFFSGDIVGHVFIADPPRTLAFTFWSPSSSAEEMKTDWTVRWDLEPIGDGCRITFQHRLLGGAHLWGLGEGWHGFLEQLLAHLDGALDALLAKRPAAGTDNDTTMLSAYRAHVARELRGWADEAAAAARAAVTNAQPDAALAAIDRLALSTKQLYEIARQDGPRPDYAPDPIVQAAPAPRP